MFGSVPEDDPQADVDEPVPVYEVPACKPEFVDDIRYVCRGSAERSIASP